MLSPLFGLFVVTALANIVTPGMTNIVMMVLAAECGWKKTIPSILATACGLALIYALSLSVIGMLIATSPLLFAAIKLAGVFFLLTFARESWKKARRETAIARHIAAKRDETPREMFKKGFLVTLTNPQPVIFSLTVFPQFIDETLPYWPQVSTMLAFYLAAGLAVKLTYTILADRLSRFFLEGRGPAVIYRSSASLLTAIALVLLVNIVKGFL